MACRPLSRCSRAQAIARDRGSTGLLLVGLIALVLLIYGWMTGHLPQIPEKAANRWYELDAPLICRRLLIKKLHEPGSYVETSAMKVVNAKGSSAKLIEWSYSLGHVKSAESKVRCLVEKEKQKVSLVEVR